MYIRRFCISLYFDEDKKSLELGSNVQHEACVGSKPFNVTFIACVDKDGATFAPEMTADEVLLVEDSVALWLETKMVKILREVTCLKVKG